MMGPAFTFHLFPALPDFGADRPGSRTCLDPLAPYGTGPLRPIRKSKGRPHKKTALSRRRYFLFCFSALARRHPSVAAQQAAQMRRPVRYCNPNDITRIRDPLVVAERLYHRNRRAVTEEQPLGILGHTVVHRSSMFGLKVVQSNGPTPSRQTHVGRNVHKTANGNPGQNLHSPANTYVESI